MFKVGDKVKCTSPVDTLEKDKIYEIERVDAKLQRGRWKPGLIIKDHGWFYVERFESVSDTKPHKHAALIKAWADNPKLKFEYSHDGGDHWMVIVNPTWIPEYKYRIKPEPKPDVVLYGCENNPFAQGQLQDDGSIIMRSIMTSRRVDADQAKFTFDGETGKLKAVEILSK